LNRLWGPASPLTYGYRGFSGGEALLTVITDLIASAETLSKTTALKMATTMLFATLENFLTSEVIYYSSAAKT
jgi:hypothetical protein